MVLEVTPRDAVARLRALFRSPYEQREPRGFLGKIAVDESWFDAVDALAGPLLAVVEAAAKDHNPARCGKLREAVGLPPGRCHECEALTALARAVEETHGD